MLFLSLFQESEEDSCCSSVSSAADGAMGVPIAENILTTNRLQQGGEAQHSPQSTPQRLQESPKSQPSHINGSCKLCVGLHS